MIAKKWLLLASVILAACGANTTSSVTDHQSPEDSRLDQLLLERGWKKLGTLDYHGINGLHGVNFATTSLNRFALTASANCAPAVSDVVLRPVTDPDNPPPFVGVDTRFLQTNAYYGELVSFYLPLPQVAGLVFDGGGLFLSSRTGAECRIKLFGK